MFLAFSPFLVINLIQFLSVMIFPFSPKGFRQINRFLANYYWGLLVFLLEKVNRIQIDIQGDKVPDEENAVVDCNHQNIGDIPIMMVLAWRKKRLGDLKFFVKDIVKYIPGPGWGMLFIDCIFVKRNWLSDKDHINKTFQKFTSNKIPIWIVSFLEGTRITPSKLARSQSFAKKRKLPHMEHVMAPRTKGFISSVQSLRSQLDAVYNLTIYYPDGIPSLWQLFRGDCKSITLHVRRTAIADLPSDEKELETWIIDAYVRKNQLIAAFKQSRVED